MKTNITIVDLSCKHQVTIPAFYQYDYGQYLKIVGVNLPTSYEVLFSSNNQPAKKVLGDANGVMVPDEYLSVCYQMKAYIFLHAGAADGETVYVITIPVVARPAATNEPVTPVEQDIIEQTIAALNNAIEITDENVELTSASAEAAAESASASAASAQEAAETAASIQDIKEEAEQAIQAAADALEYRDAAGQYASDAAGSASASAASASASAGSATASAGSASNALASANASAQSAAAASGSASAAAGSATSAAGSATDAANSATASAGSATAASGSASASESSALKSEGFAIGEQNGSAVESGSPYYENNAKYYKEQAAASAAASESSAEDSEAWAVGQRDGTDVEPSDPTYQNNAKYYADNAGLFKQYALDAYATDKIENAPIASFPDGADNVPMKSATFAITPVQDLHGYDSPWPAGGGVNKWDEIAEEGGINSTTGGNISGNTSRAKNYISVTPNATYYAFATQRIYLRFYRADKSYIGYLSADGKSSALNETFTIPSDCYYFRFVANNEIQSKSVAINYPSSVTTYSPYSNECPITGFTGAEVTDRGVNLWDEEWEVGLISSATGENTTGEGFRSKNYIPIKPNATLYLYNGTFIGAARNAQTRFYDAQKNYIGYVNASGNTVYWNDASCTTPSNAYYMRFAVPKTYYETDVYQNDISINYPSTDTAYHASVGTTHNITWSDAAGTVYGGTLQYLGGDAWRLTSNRVLRNINGNNNWAGQYRNSIGWAVAISVNSGESALLGSYPICSILPSGTIYSNFSNASRIENTSTLPFSLSDEITGLNASSTLADINTAFKAFFAANNAQLVYELATPVTYDLTGDELATVLGDNNVFASTGDVTELVYRADTALYVQKMIANALNA